MENADSLAWLLAAAAVLFAAHVVRAVRWAVLFSPRDLARRFHLLMGLALGYMANAVVPWRLGEVLRTWYVSRRASVRFSYVAATVAAERLSDLVVVAALGSLLSLGSNAPWRWMTTALAALACVLLVLACVGVQRSARVRLWVWRFASVFNDRLRFSVVDFAWSFSELLAGGALLRWRYVAASVLMWCLYLASYALFSVAVSAPFEQSFFELLGRPLRPAMAQFMTGWVMHATALAVFTSLPVLGVVGYGVLRQWSRIFRALQMRRRYGWYAERAVSGGARNRFRAEAEYDYFLASLFSGHNKAASRFGMEALENGTVHKLYGGGSDAITALVEIDSGLVIRKFASGDAGKKLQLQQEWLVRHRVDGFPLVRVLGGHARASAYYYDMPLVVPANDFFDFIHSNPLADSRRIVGEVLDRISVLHRTHLTTHTPRETVHRYLLEKAVRNARQVIDFAHALVSDGAYQVNGLACHLDRWKVLVDMDWLSRQIELDSATIVHGDLTIENIIVAPTEGPGWYIIDPNPDNIFHSPLIDWSKMLQSLHLGYEGLNRNFSCVVEGPSIRMAFTRSQAYTQLHQFVDERLLAQFGERGVREAYFHELVHYLRLMPYKIRQNPQKGLAFFACTSVLLHEYRERWNA